MNIRALSIALLFVTSAAFGQFSLRLPPSPVDMSKPGIVRFSVAGVEKWEQVDDVIVFTARDSVPDFVDVMWSMQPGEWGLSGPAGHYAIRVKMKGGPALTGSIVLGSVPKPVDPIVKPVEPVTPPTPPVVDPPKPPDNTKKKVAKVTYVYEKDHNAVPRPVSAALQRINREHAGLIVASEFEDDTVDGDGDTPDQFKNALRVSRNFGSPGQAGVPILVVEAADGTILNTVKAPTTEKQVMEAIAL